MKNFISAIFVGVLLLINPSITNAMTVVDHHGYYIEYDENSLEIIDINPGRFEFIVTQGFGENLEVAHYHEGDSEFIYVSINNGNYETYNILNDMYGSVYRSIYKSVYGSEWEE